MHSKIKRADEVEAAFTNLGLELDEFIAEDNSVEPVRQTSRPTWLVPLLLLVATLISMAWAGIAAWVPGHLLENAMQRGSLFEIRRHVLANWIPGLLFSVSLATILGAHELGHYFATRIYRIRSSLPIFIPFPIAPMGTCGAVILMDGMQADRRQIFDIGLAGPLAGLVFAIPIAAVGMLYGEPPETRGHSVQFGQPLVIQALAEVLPTRIASEEPNVMQQKIKTTKSIGNDSMNPLLMAAWVGFLVTGLNMVPISQLDGGHVIFGLMGQKSGNVCWLVYLASIGYVGYTSLMFGEPMFFLMLLLIPLMGISHPPSRDDTVPLGLLRQIIGTVSLAIPVLCIPFRPMIFL